jgi:hypothetical protein
MTYLLAIQEDLPVGGELDLSDDRRSCELFWATLLDFAAAENGEYLSFGPDQGDECLNIKINGEWLCIGPPPKEIRDRLLRFAQRMVLGPMLYYFRIRMTSKRFLTRGRPPILVRVGKRESRWAVECGRDGITFVRNN